MSNMPWKTYNQLQHAFWHKIAIDSEWVVLHCVALLAGIEPVHINCCVISCIAYTRQYVHMEECPICQEPRYSQSRRACRIFSYLPIIPRLQGFFKNPETAQLLLYCHNYTSSPDTITDIFNCEWYTLLRNKTVTIDGVKRAHKYFEHKYDMALSLALDNYLLFKRCRGGPSATPILLQNFNLPPHICTHLD